MMLNGAHSDRSDERPLHVAVPLLLSGAGFFGFAVLRQPILAVFFLALVPIGHCAAYGPFWSMPSRFLAGAPAAAVGAFVWATAEGGGLFCSSIIRSIK